MKKIVILFLAGIICLSICACDNGTENQVDTTNEIKTEADVAGTYKSVGLYFDAEYHLNTNTTFDIINGKQSNGTQGTYIVDYENNVSLKPTDSSKLTINEEGNLYYIEGFMDCFEKDEEYGLKPTFDENGRSKQTFRRLYGDTNYSYEIGLNLNDDGTYSGKYKKITNVGLIYDIDNTYEGTYKFENDILWLNYKGKDYPMLFVKDKLYFDIIEKTE